MIPPFALFLLLLLTVLLLGLGTPHTVTYEDNDGKTRQMEMSAEYIYEEGTRELGAGCIGGSYIFVVGMFFLVLTLVVL